MILRRACQLAVFAAAVCAAAPGVWAQDSKAASGYAPATTEAKPASESEVKATAEPDGKGGSTPGSFIRGSMRPGMEPGKPGGEPGKPGESKPGGPGKPDEKGKDAKPEEPSPLQRPTKPDKPPNPEEIKKAKPDKDGKVTFNFKGQPWPLVLEWLAEISGMSLDWQELPGDYLNLITQRPYAVREVRDLINSHLLARGYTLLIQDGVLTVVNVKKLNPALVPRVEPDELAKRDPHEFVKVSFALDWLAAESIADELKTGLLSPNAKLTPLRSSNRLEVIDAVVNLREVQAFLKAEQSAENQEGLVREFVLQFARASEVVEQVRSLIGPETKSAGTPGQPMSPEQQMQMQRMMQMGGQQPGQPGQPGQPQPGQQPGHAAKGKPSETNLTVNARRNSILVTAPPDKMALIAQAIKALDVPAGQDQSILTSMNRVQVYRLAAIDPEPLVKTLQELGNLSPSTRLEVDKKNRAIIANAPLADHVVIRALVEKLDASERKFEVITLRRLPADYVAGTIEFMMVGEKPKEQRRPWYYYDFDGGSRRQQDDQGNKFRVDADVEYNRLLLWANPIEMEEVRNLLVKLGEVPAEGDRTTRRVLEVAPGKDADALLETIRQKWPALAPNPLILPPPQTPPAKAPAEEKQPATDKKAPAKPAAEPKPEQKPAPATATASESAAVIQWAQYRSPSGVAAAAPANAAAAPNGQNVPAAAPIVPDPRAVQPAPAGAPPPVTIERAPDGRLIISSSDTEALDRLEELAFRAAAPSPNDFQIFRLKYAWASGVAGILKDVFKEDDKKNRDRPWFFYDDYYSSQDNSDKERTRLSKRRPLRIISDIDTNSILVQGADAGQLKKIDELVKFYDKPEPTDAQSVRKTEIFRLKYAKAKNVLDTLKDVYRDLLSANDKALASNNQQRSERSYTYVFGESEDKGQKMPTFKGLLSVGMDDLSNTLVISAPAYLMEGVSKIVNELDEAAQPQEDTVNVVRIGPNTSAEMIEEALSRVMGQGGKTRTPKPKPAQATPAPKPNGRASASGHSNGAAHH